MEKYFIKISQYLYRIFIVLAHFERQTMPIKKTMGQKGPSIKKVIFVQNKTTMTIVKSNANESTNGCTFSIICTIMNYRRLGYEIMF